MEYSQRGCVTCPRSWSRYLGSVHLIPPFSLHASQWELQFQSFYKCLSPPCEIGYVGEQLQSVKTTGAVRKEEDHPHTEFVAENQQRPVWSNMATNFTWWYSLASVYAHYLLNDIPHHNGWKEKAHIRARNGWLSSPEKSPPFSPEDLEYSCPLLNSLHPRLNASQ